MQLFFIKSHEWSLNLKISVIFLDSIPIFTLNITINSTWIILSWIVTDFSFKMFPKRRAFIVINLSQSTFIQLVYLLINASTMTHPGESAIAEHERYNLRKNIFENRDDYKCLFQRKTVTLKILGPCKWLPEIIAVPLKCMALFAPLKLNTYLPNTLYIHKSWLQVLFWNKYSIC